MSSMSKKQIESQYKSYEEAAKAFSSEVLGTECTEIYLYSQYEGGELTHYKMVRKPGEREEVFNSPYTHNVKLAWSKKDGAVIPFKS